MSQAVPELIAIGGFPGSGKSTVAGALASDLGYPVLASDLFGNAIKGVLTERNVDRALSSLAFRAGYTTLFAVAEEILSHRCPVIIDCSLGWQFQWDELDAISRRTGAPLRPFVLKCSRRTCVRRLQQRHLTDPSRNPPAEEFLAQPHLDGVRQLLDTIARPDLHRVDTDRPITQVCRDIRDILRA